MNDSKLANTLRRPRLIRRWVGVGVAILAVVGIVLTYFMIQQNSDLAFFKNVQKRVNFPVYYSATPPSGVGLDRSSLSVTNDVVLVNYNYDGDKKLLLSYQSKGNLDVSSFNATADFTTTVGHAYLADLDSRTTAAVVGDNSLVIINAPSKIAIDRLTQFINSLRPIK